MKNETWTRWEPAPMLASEYYVESITKTRSTLELLLSEDQQERKLKLSFLDPVYSYRTSDERYRIMTFFIIEKQGGGDVFKNWSFFKVINSSYVDWVARECSVHLENVAHFSILAVDPVIDVLCAADPKVKSYIVDTP